jgi:signal transduction histidine kinase/HAMP domain-containing protein
VSPALNERGPRAPAQLGAALAMASLLLLFVAVTAVHHHAAATTATAAQAARRELASSLARAAAAALRAAVVLEDHGEIARIADGMRLAEPALAGVTVTLANGRVVRSGPPLSPPADGVQGGADARHDPWTASAPLLAPAHATGVVLQATDPLPATVAQRTVGSVEIRVDAPPAPPGIAAQLATLSLPSAALVLTALLLWVGVVLHVRRRWQRLAELAAALASGRFDALPPVGGNDEVGWIAAELQTIAVTLGARVERIEDRNLALARDVHVRGEHIERLAQFASVLVTPIAAPELEAPSELPPDGGASAGGDGRGEGSPDLLAALTSLMDAVQGELAGLWAIREGEPSPIAACGTSVAALHPSPRTRDLLATVLHAAEPVELPPLRPDHPWMRAHARQVPLEGVLGVALRFGAHVEAIALLARRSPWGPSDQRLIADARRPWAIALANRRAFSASLALARGLSARNDELARQADELAAAQRLQRQFVANMSHELRTPLNAILGYSELLLDDCFGPLAAEQREPIAGIYGTGSHLLQIVNHVLDLSKAEAGELLPRGQPTPLHELLREAVRMSKGLTRDRPYDAVFSGPELTLDTDPEMVRQIVTNLLGNAIKFTASGSVTVSLRPTPNGGATIAVSDTGPGIDPAHFELVFAAFRQVDGTATRTHDGAGLGLAIARRFALALGGRIELDSQLGRGSTFTLHLPPKLPQPAFELVPVDLQPPAPPSPAFARAS